MKEFIVIVCAFFIVIVLSTIYCIIAEKEKVIKIDIPTCAELIANNDLMWDNERRLYQIEIELSDMRNDIFKRQIRNIQAENDGLRTIINDDEKIRHLITTK